MYLDGYWQSERYFAHNSEAIRRDFTLREPLDVANMEILAKIKTVNSVSLHVRRGDYISDPRTNEFHGACSLDYYYTALSTLQSVWNTPHIFIFSDDHGWVRII